jgi:hypothetical protein
MNPLGRKREFWNHRKNKGKELMLIPIINFIEE